MPEDIKPKDGILATALEQENVDIAKTNVARVRSELNVIRQEKAVIATHQKNIAAAQKRISEYSETPALTAKDIMA